ncbi:hypothetical protein BZA70DRAFT_56746 [Myxozyma melibiosi]|uniref:Zn(2)-C6 fungal-type domain-containing protein n=1 Tax=Myxozyma melibiosi TaxID=54550 RepID=A0ABR1FFH2_9ASCO
MPYTHPHPTSPGSPECGTRKRVGKACDSCRIKKSKCDGRKPCSRCTADDKICTFTERKKSKEKLYSSRYVELLENRIEILQTGMEELVKRVSRGDNISNLLTKSGHVSINRALDELTNKNFELQKEEHERIVDVHDDSEHDTDHEHDSADQRNFDEKMEDKVLELKTEPDFDDVIAGNSWIGQTDYVLDSSASSVLQSQTDGLSFGRSSVLPPDPATIIRGHIESMSPDSMTSASSLYSPSGSSSPIDGQFPQEGIRSTAGGPLNITLDTSDLSTLPQSVMVDYLDQITQVSMADKVDDLSDVWLTTTFNDI